MKCLNEAWRDETTFFKDYSSEHKPEKWGHTQWLETYAWNVRLYLKHKTETYDHTWGRISEAQASNVRSFLMPGNTSFESKIIPRNISRKRKTTPQNINLKSKIILEDMSLKSNYFFIVRIYILIILESYRTELNEVSLAGCLLSADSRAILWRKQGSVKFAGIITEPLIRISAVTSDKPCCWRGEKGTGK